MDSDYNREQGIPALEIFGGGGYSEAIGYDEDNAEFYLEDSESGLRADLYDAGKDMAFQTFSFPLNIYNDQEADYYFRFRIRVEAANDGRAEGPLDDADDFYVSMIDVISQIEMKEVALEGFYINDPRTITPFSKFDNIKAQAVASAVISHNFPPFVLQNIANIEQYGEPEPPFEYIGRILNVPGIQNYTSVLEMPVDGNIRYEKTADELYESNNKFIALMNLPGGDYQPMNDSIFFDYDVFLGNMIAYDRPALWGHNDVAVIAGVKGRGIAAGVNPQGDGSDSDRFGASTPGEIAVRFNCDIDDTIGAVNIYFAELSDAPDEVDVRFYITDSTGLPGTDDISLLHEMTIRRGEDDGEYKYGAYVSYPIDPPLVISEDVNEDLWVAVGQKGAASFELGAASIGTGMVTTSISDDPAKIVCAPIATDYNSFDKIEGRRRAVRGDFHHFYAYRNEGGEWHSFMPEIGLPAYPHLDAEGTINGVKTYAQGTWIPMIRLPIAENTEVGVAEKPDRDINIYPNPADSRITIGFDAAPGRYAISICDELGRTLAEIDAFDWGGGMLDRSYNLPGLPTGLYILRILNGEELISGKLMIVK
jgi:hypothetical protein